MRSGQRKFIAFLLAVAGLVSAPALAYWGNSPASANFWGATAGAHACQTRRQQLGEICPRPSVPPAISSLSQGRLPEGESALPDECRLAVPLTLQNPELPNGCEATALAMVLQYHGYDADKLTLAYGYIPREDFALTGGRWTGGNPSLVYPGDPGGTGYYCLPRVVAGAANRYLSRQNAAPHIARNATGASEDELKACLAAGNPVLIWVTVDGQPPRTNPETAWYLSDTGELYQPYGNLHVVVLTSYDRDSFYVNDPQGRQSSLPSADLLENFWQMGSRAVVVE